MKPKRLEFCGINSFSEKAVIDFDKLLSGGLFGIFGDTGSGKTTILDSMIFALYGKIDRTRGGNANEIINYNCDKAYVVFDFACEWDGKRRVFRVHREIKRKNSQQNLELCEIEGDKMRGLSEGVKKTNEMILDIVGLSFEDFKKCIALPQGEFAQFVKADRGERLRLISRLFDLESYGDKLNGVLKARYDEAKLRLAEKDGRLAEYAQYTQEELKRQEEEYAVLSARKQELDGAYAREEAAFERLKNEYDRAKKLARLESALREAGGRSASFDRKRAALKKLPGASAACEASGKAAKLAEEAEKCAAAKALAEKNKAESEARLRAEEEAYAAAKYEDSVAEIKAKRAFLKTLEGDLKELTLQKTARDELAKEYKRVSSEKAQAEKTLAATEKAIGRLTEPGGEAAENLETFLRGNFESALLRSEYEESEKYFSGALGRLREKFPPQGELYFAAEKELSEQAQKYRDLCEGEKSSDAFALLEKFKKMQEERGARQKERHDLEIEREKLSAKLAETNAALARILEDGAKAKERIDSITNKMTEAFGDDFSGDPALYARRLEKEEAGLLLEQGKRLAEQKALQQKIGEIALAIARAEEKTVSLLRSKEEALGELSARLTESGLADVKEAAELLRAYPNADILRGEIEQYENEVREIEAGIRALKTDGAPAPVSEEDFAKKAEEFAALREQRERAGKECAVFKNEIERFTERLGQKKQIEQERAECKKGFDLVEKMRKLFYGNAFMEFVAGEYLSDISAAATETLLRLTNGRYFIRYEQGFFVGDNFNAGDLRSVNTLSGGETFLVSLSLALALSAAIYAKSLRPIEFFFLDEGFGTLDEKLIDTVMDSLEKLKNTHFSIGLISHVEELKHRIDNKITVISAPEAGGSSKIKISC